MICKNCGAYNPAGHRFCNQCGNPLEDASTSNPTKKATVKIRVCPNCGGLSPIDVWNCISCGGNLDVYTIQEVDAEMIKGLDEFDTSKTLSQRFKELDELPKNVKETMLSRIEQESLEREAGVTTHDHQTRVTSQHYYALQGMASLCKGLAIAVAVIALFGAIGSLVILISAAIDGDNITLGLVGLGISVIFGVSFHLLLRIFAEGIFVILDLEKHSRQIEANTRDTTRLLKQLLLEETPK